MSEAGQIESIDRFPVVALIWGLLALALISVGIALHNFQSIIASVPALTLASGLYFFRSPRFSGRLGDQALVLAVPEATIPYDTIQSVSLAGRPQDPDKEFVCRPIVIVHEGGIVTIPTDINARPESLYRALASKTVTSGSRDIHPDMVEHMAQEMVYFSEERVWTFRGRKANIGRPGNIRLFRIFALLMPAAGFCCIAPFFLFNAAKSENAIPWLLFGIALAFISLIGMLTTMKSSRLLSKSVPRWQESSLVISPSGIAMIQGNMRGHMRWDELREIQMGKLRPATFAIADHSAVLPSIKLVVAGAAIHIYDIYDRPLPSIEKIARRLWPRASES